MTTKVLSNYITGGYTLAAAYNELVVEPGAGAAGGVYSNHYATVFNDGRLGAGKATGLVLHAGGEVQNGIGGYTSARINGVEIDNAAGTVFNSGTISIYGAGVFLGKGGEVVNGDDTDTGALIAGLDGVGVEGAAAFVKNYGTIRGLGSIGAVELEAGGTVINGTNRTTSALIDGGQGVSIAGSGTVTNWGTIEGGDGGGVELGQGVVRNLGQILGLYDGVKLSGAGSVTNGSATNRVAAITGYTGVEAVAGAAVTNYGTVTGEGGAHGAYGAVLRAGGALINGSGTQTDALITGYVGVAVLGAVSGYVHNFGTVEGFGAKAAGVMISGSAQVFNGAAGLIEGGVGVSLATGGGVQNRGTIRGEGTSGLYGAGVLLSAGGSVSNGYASDRTALIVGDYGVFAVGSANIANLGTIIGDYHSAGVDIYNGSVTNGSTRNAAALIAGYVGVKLTGVAALANFGNVAGTGGYGVLLDGTGETVTNGAAGHAKANITGYQGVFIYGANETVDNFGTIGGDGGTALSIYAGSVFLKVEGGCAFQGAILGNGASTLDLASGAGTLSGLSGSAVTVSGSMATTAFSNFATVEVGAGAVFTLTGKATVIAGQTLVAAGVLTASGAMANAGLLETLGGTLIVSGAVTGGGSATINGGTMDFAAAFNQAVAFGAAGVLELAQSQTYTANVTGFSKTGTTSLDLVDIGFVSPSQATFAGNSKGGVLTVTDGTHTAHINLKGNYLSSVFVCSSDGHGGTLVVDPKARNTAAPTAVPSPHLLVAAMAALGASGGVMSREIDHHPVRAPLIARPHVMIA